MATVYYSSKSHVLVCLSKKHMHLQPVHQIQPFICPKLSKMRNRFASNYFPALSLKILMRQLSKHKRCAALCYPHVGVFLKKMGYCNSYYGHQTTVPKDT